MSVDARGWRLALTADSLVNPPRGATPAITEAFGILAECGYGVVQLPPPGAHTLLLAVTADQIAEYAHHGYAVAAVGVHGERSGGLHWRRLAPLLRVRGIAAPPRHLVHPDGDAASERQRLHSFLSGFDLPQAERERWRV
jgi:hypothetical protein